MWVISDYIPTTLFSLRPATATSSGGKSLLAPTPYAVKMALLDAAIRTRGIAYGRDLFPTLRDLRVAVRLPDHIVVNSTFTKILRLKESKAPKAQQAAALAAAQANRQWPFQNTIAYREYVQLAGELSLALSGITLTELTGLLLQVNYLGKRGGFMQLRTVPREIAELPTGYTDLTADTAGGFPLGVLQLLDDFGPNATYAHADVFSDKRVTLGKERILRHVVLPYRVERSSRSFTLYERLT